MRKLVYHAAITLDNFIAREDGSIQGFLEEGDHIQDFFDSYKNYDTVLMGRGAYEFGYNYGLQPGQAPYPTMKNFVFSKTLRFGQEAQVEIISRDELSFIRKLKEMDGLPIWLCGGGKLAQSLFENELIDELILKVNPVVFGWGIRLFGESKKKADLTLLDTKIYKSGVALLTYRLDYKDHFE